MTGKLSGALLEKYITVETVVFRNDDEESVPFARMRESEFFFLCKNVLVRRREVHKRILSLPQVEFANPQVQVPLTGARRQIQFPRPFGARGGAQRGPNVAAGPETYQHYHRRAISSCSSLGRVPTLPNVMRYYSMMINVYGLVDSTGSRGALRARAQINPGR